MTAGGLLNKVSIPAEDGSDATDVSAVIESGSVVPLSGASAVGSVCVVDTKAGISLLCRVGVAGCLDVGEDDLSACEELCDGVECV